MSLEFLESVQYFRRSEGELEIAPPPPSGARYKNTPVGRGLIAIRKEWPGRTRHHPSIKHSLRSDSFSSTWVTWLNAAQKINPLNIIIFSSFLAVCKNTISLILILTTPRSFLAYKGVSLVAMTHGTVGSIYM